LRLDREEFEVTLRLVVGACRGFRYSLFMDALSLEEEELNIGELL
jgi:hypothetical protein